MTVSSLSNQSGSLLLSSASKFGDHFAGSAIFAEIRFVVAMIAQPTTMDIVYEIISFSSPAFQFFSY